MAAKTIKAGSRITWTQYDVTGHQPVTRTGTVWSPAIIDTGVTNAWWTHPDQPSPDDTYPVVYVGRASKDNHYTGHPHRGEVYSSHKPQDITAYRTRNAHRVTHALAA